jgi:two-component system chemotaxis sensor kinase CheA
VPPRQRTTLRRKFIWTMLVVCSLIGATTLAIVLLLSSRASTRRLREVETNIENVITSKGRILTENHALALRGMVLDNAFTDMQTLLERAVNDDTDLVYGLFTNPDGDALALKVRATAHAPSASLAKDAWRQLGLQATELNVTQESIRRTHRLGDELVEVAVPLFGEEHEALGTLRYGLSTQRMHTALAAAQADAKAQQLQFIELIGLSVSLATLFGILLSRSQAVRITLPVQDLTQAATDLASGDRNVRVKIESGDELEMLGFSFNHMVWELASSYDKLAELNRNLEHKVEERTLALVSRNQDMRAVLDNVDQGLITVAPDGTMASERSAAVDKWFGAPVGSTTLWQSLETASPSFALNLEVGWDQVKDDLLPLETAIDQLPKRLSTKAATYELRYLPLLRDAKLQSVLVVIADITSQLLHEREEAESRELTQVVRRLMRDRSGFLAFLQEAGSLLDLIATPAVAESDLKRALHTLKGNSALMGLSVVAELCHGLEDGMVAEGALPARQLLRLRERWQTLTAQISELVPESSGVVEVAGAELAALSTLLEHTGQSEALRRVATWKLEHVGRPLSRLAEQAQDLAKRLGKGELAVEVLPGNVRLDAERFRPVYAELSHVIRNAVDHGIESSEEREQAGKSPHGRLTLSAHGSDDWVRIEIGDDGRGIDCDGVRGKGRELELPTATSEDLVAILCREGFSTRSEVTDISGRGIGMAAVKRRVENMGGRLELKTVLGQGTTWSLVIPLQASEQRKRLAS